MHATQRGSRSGRTLAVAILASSVLAATLARDAGARAGIADPRAAGRDVAPTVIVLSWDGVRHDYLDRGSLPALERILREGARAERLIPPFPSLTFPSHVSLATGAPVDRHGIVANRFFDRERGEFDYENDASWLEAEPLWAAAERQGVRSAVFFWVGSETDWRGTGASYRESPFDARVPEARKVERILEWLDLPPARRPGLVMAWWHGADNAGHHHGPDSAETVSAMREQDAVLGQLLAGLDAREAWASTTLLIVSDHGMTPAGDRIDAHALLADAGIHSRVAHASALANVYLDDPAQQTAAIEVLDAAPGVRAFARDALPERLRYRHPGRVGHVVALADPPRVFGRGGAPGMLDRIDRLLGRTTGAHGYDPASVPDMAGILVAIGRGVAPGARLPAASALDVAPTVAALLGIEPPAQSEGKPIALATEAPGSTPQQPSD